MTDQHMKDFNSAVSGYLSDPNASTTAILLKVIDTTAAYLRTQTLQSTSTMTTEFHCHLFELMESCEASSPFIWKAINLLQVICKDPGARQTLIDQYTFIPYILRVVSPDLITDERITVLSLLQELTDGIKIEYPELYLVKFISTLTEWIIDSTNECEILFLSLSVLLNVSKNLAAAYILMKEVDIKKLYRRLMTMDGVDLSIRVQSCRLLVIMDKMNQKLPECAVVEMISMMMENFPAVIDTKNQVTVKLFVEFLVEMEANSHFRPGLLEFTNYALHINKIISILNSTTPEIVVLIIKLFNALVKLNHPDIISLHVDIFNLSINWITNEQTVVDALGLLRTILDHNSDEQKKLIELINLDSILSIRNTPENNLLKLTELMKLLLVIVKLSSLHEEVSTKFGYEKMRELLEPLIHSSGCWEPDKIRFFIHALALIALLSEKNVQWLMLFDSLTKSREVQMLVAIAIYTGDSEIKTTALMLFSFGYLNKDFHTGVSNCMCELDPITQINIETRAAHADIECRMLKCIERALPFTDKKEFDEIFKKLLDLAKQNKIENVEVIELLEIYEHDKKIAKKENNMYMESFKNANRRVADLTNLLKHMQENNEKIHQMLFFSQQNEAKWKAEVARKTRTNELKEKTISLEKLQKNYAELQEQKNSLLNSPGQLDDKISSLSASQDDDIELDNKAEKLLKQTLAELNKKKEDVSRLNQIIVEKENELKSLESEKEMFENLISKIYGLTALYQSSSS